MKNPTEFTLISGNDGSIETFADDKVREVVGTYSTWVSKSNKEDYYLYVRPVLLSEDKPARVSLFTQISEGEKTQSVICDMYTRVDLTESPT